ncbi:MAG: holo-ACP synthase [Deltaproteobacteria bacterium]|nr:holo-ACP synthase [Deltaproteobacteria bacterium]
MIEGIGIDIVEVERFKGAVERRGERFLKRLFTDREILYSRGKRRPEVHLAARFAAKVSVKKAFGSPLNFREIEISNDGSGRPVAEAKALGKDLRISISITHDNGLAVAEALIERL